MLLTKYGLLKGQAIGAKRETEPPVSPLPGSYASGCRSVPDCGECEIPTQPIRAAVFSPRRFPTFDHDLSIGVARRIHTVAESAGGGGAALDFIRGNLFNRLDMRLLPPNLPGPNNDLSDQIEHYVARAIQEPDAKIYAFGQRWGPEEDVPDKVFRFTLGNGIHDIHMNQGNVPPHTGDDGV